MATTSGLTDTKQAYLTLGAFLLPSVSVWALLGFPTSTIAVGLLVSNLITGFLMFAKEKLGIVVTPATTAVTTAKSAMARVLFLRRKTVPRN